MALCICLNLNGAMANMIVIFLIELFDLFFYIILQGKAEINYQYGVRGKK